MISERAGAVRRVILTLLIASAGAAALLRAQSNVTLSSPATPNIAQPGVHTINVTGSNFPSGTINPASVNVTIVPASASSGTTATTPASAVTTIVGTTRRVTFTIPSSISVTTPTAYQVSVAGTTSTGIAFASGNRAAITINPPAAITSLNPSVIAPGTTVTVTITTQYTNFFQGSTQANFGPGISVGGAAEGAFGPVSVSSPTQATAQLLVSATAQLGGHVVTVRTGVQSATLQNSFNVVRPNQPPVITSPAPTAASEGRPYAYAVQTSDPDGDAVNVTLDQAPQGMTIANGSIAWTPTANHVGPQPVIVRATDTGGLFATQSFSVIVAANASPVITSTPVTTAVEGSLYTYQIVANDPDGDAFSYGLDQFPAGMTVNPAGLISWTPTTSQVGPHPIIVSITDARGAKTQQSFAIEVAGINHLPVANAGGPYSGTAGVAVHFDAGQSSDPDQDALVYHWLFGDGSSADGVSPTHIYNTAETFTATLTIEDGHGGTATSSASVLISPAALGRGVIAQRVYNDRNGLPLEAASARLVNAGTDDYLSDAAGRIRISRPVGTSRLRISKNDFTTVERAIEVVDGKRVDPLDARLTPLDANVVVVAAVPGGTVNNSTGDAALVIPGGALANDAAVRVTRIGDQGLSGLLPFGWSPIAAVDVFTSSVALSTAHLSLTLTEPISVSTPAVVARYDLSSGSWIAGGTANRSDDGKQLSAEIGASGQYALIVGDAAPDNPPLPIAGQPLEGVAPRAPPNVVVSINPAPRILFAQPDAHSQVGLLATPDTRLPSGTPAQVTVSETFAYTDGTHLYTAPHDATHPLYTSPAGGASLDLKGGFVATPSRNVPPFALQLGTIDLTVRMPGNLNAGRGTVVGPNGGTATTATGERLSIPAGASTEDVPVLLTPLAQSDFPAPLPIGFTFAGGVTVDLHGAQLSRPASLGIARSNIPAGAQFLVVQLIEAGGVSHLGLVAAVVAQGNLLVSSVDPFGNGSLPFPGVRGDGRYVFLQTSQPLGFVTGIVNGLDGSPLSDAIVAANGSAIVGVTNGAGRYVVAGPAGAVQINATNVSTRDTFSAGGTIAPNAVSNIAVSLVATPPSVVAVTPANNATAVELSSALRVVFSEAIDPASLTSNAFVISTGGSSVAGLIALEPGGASALFRPNTLLASDTTYQVAVAATVRDLAGNLMGTPFNSQFRTVDLTPPPLPPAGAISVTIPDANGNVIVSGTQGTADPGGVVIVRNLTTPANTTITPNSNGSFSGTVKAKLTDKLEVVIRDANLNTTTVALGPFRNADGSTVVGAEGGHVEGPGGISADVPSGALPAGTVVKLEPVSEAEFPIQLSQAAKENFTFAGGIRLSLTAPPVDGYINLSIPTTGGETASDRWVVAEVLEIGGQQQFNVIDTARVINGRITTSSPPCPGVTRQAIYGFLKSGRPVGVAYGNRVTTSAIGGIAVRTDLPAVTFYAADNPATPQQEFGVIQAFPFCLPLLSSGVTIGSNTQQVRVAPNQLAPADRQIVVKNTTRGTTFRYPREVVEYQFKVDGKVDDQYQVLAEDVNSELTEVTAFKVSPFAAGSVLIRLNMNQLKTSIQDITVKNLTRIAQTPGYPPQFFPQTTLGVTVSAEGDAQDQFTVLAVNVDHVERTVAFELLPPAVPGGNLVVRAIPDTIDPTVQEIADHNAADPANPIDAAGVTLVQIRNKSVIGPGAFTTVPISSIRDGGFTIALNGAVSDKFAIDVTYEACVAGHEKSGCDGHYSADIPSFPIVVVNPATGRVIKNFTIPAPPQDQPLNLGIVSDDVQAPRVTESPARLRDFDASSPITFRFNEAMDAQGLKDGFVVKDSQGHILAGEVRVSDGNRLATFVPNAALKLGEKYTITLTNVVKDVSGNALVYPTLTLTTFKPIPRLQLRTGKDNRLLEPVKDLDFVQSTAIDGTLHTTLVAVTDTYPSTAGSKVLAFDATDPDDAHEVGGATVGFFKKRITVLPHVSFAIREPLNSSCGVSGSTYTGDLAVTTSFNTQLSYLSFVDVSDPTKPCLLANKLLTATPETAVEATERGTIPALGFARGVATIQHTTGYAAYAAVGEVGLMAADIGNNIPEPTPPNRGTPGVYAEGFVPGDFTDVDRLGTRLLALDAGRGQPPTLRVFGGNLSQTASLVLDDVPRRVAHGTGFTFDLNHNGLLDQNEVFDLAFVATDRNIQIVNVTAPDDPRVAGRIQTPWLTPVGPPRDMAVDAAKQRLYVSGTDGESNRQSIYIIDLSHPFLTIAPDDDGNGRDDRIIGQLDFPEGLFGFRIDTSRGLAYIGRHQGLDIYALYGNCCDIAVDFSAESEESLSGEAGDLLPLEKQALQQGIAKGLASVQTTCGVSVSLLTMLEQGSGACVWKDDPVKACGSAYQPGLSDHDFEVFFPASIFPLVDGPLPAAVDCTINELNGQFADPATKAPKPVKVGNAEVTFADVTFYPFSKEAFESAKLTVFPPRSTSGGDPGGDFALGRQQLLLGKWLLEGEYVHGVADYNLEGQSFDAILERLKTQTKIPALEGFESASLQEYALTKSKAFLRIKGASDPGSAFHDLYVKQLHDAAKAGIRAALGRMIINDRARDLVLNIVRRFDRFRPKIPSYDTDACLTIDPAVQDPNAWKPRPCTGLEDWVASVAGRSLRGPNPLTIFTRAEVVGLVDRFFKVKADVVRIDDEAEANQFISDVALFIEKVKVDTKPIYLSTIEADPDKDIRLNNVVTVIAKTDKALKHASLHIVPHVSNEGFSNGNGLEVRMFRDTGAPGAQVRTTTVNLSGGQHRFLQYEEPVVVTAEDLDFIDRNLLVLQRVESKSTKPLFVLGEASKPENPEIDLSTGFSQAHWVAFTIDLPDQPAKSRMKEANRQNNYNGFFFYVLDRGNPTVPATADKPPFPLADTNLLNPDLQCANPPRLEITHSMIVGGQEVTGEVSLGLGEQATVRLTLRNRSSEAVHNVLVSSHVLGTSTPLDTVGPGTTTIRDLPYIAPLVGRIIDGTPLAYSAETGTVSGAPQRVLIACEAYRVEALFDPVLQDSSVMRGGTAYRYFRVVNRRTGAPRANAEVKVLARGFFNAAPGTKSYTFHTDAKGLIVENNEPGMAFPFDASMTAETELDLSIDSVDGVVPCLQTTFRIDLKDREFTQSYARGASVSGSIGVLALGFEGSHEAGLELEIEKTSGGGAQRLNLTETSETTTQLGGEFSLFELDAGFGVGQLKISAEAGTSGTKATGSSTTFSFDYPLDGNERCAISRITLLGVSGNNSAFAKLFDALRQQGCSVDPYKSSQAETFSRAAHDEGTLEISASRPVPKLPNAKKGIGVKFGGEAGADFGLTTSYGKAFTTPAGGGPAVQSSVTESYALTGGLDFSAGLTLNVANRPDDEDEEEELEKTIGKQKDAIKTEVSDSTVETYEVEFETDFNAATDFSKPTAINVTYTGPKGFGLKTDVRGTNVARLGPGSSGAITYTIDRPEDIQKAIDTLASLKVIRDTNVVTNLSLQELPLAPSVLNEELSKFWGLLKTITPTYSISANDGDSSAFPIGLGGKLVGLKLGGSVEVNSEQKISYLREKGVVYDNASYPLEKYPKETKPRASGSLVPLPDLGLWDIVEAAWSSLLEDASSGITQVLETILSVGHHLKSPHSAEMVIDGTKEPQPFEAGIISYGFRTIDGPVPEGRYRPADTVGRAGDPHYGIGWFHNFTPIGYTLAAPTPLVIDYTDDEVTGLDESSLAIYGWNSATADWDYVGGTLDTTANTVTTTVQAFRQYTLGPAMPARAITLTTDDHGLSGAGPQATRRFTVTSDALVMNNGQPVPNGTQYTIRPVIAGATAVEPYGTVLAADANPARNEIQVQAIDGRITFDVEYPAPDGAYLPGRIVVYSTTGTAVGEVIAVANQ